MRIWCSLLLLAACKAPPADGALPDPICPGPAAWGDGPAFIDVTEAWGLIGVEGTRLAAVDVDGDGWTDLHVARAADAPDDFSPGGERATWLLRNEGNRFVDVTEASGLRQVRGGDDARGRAGQVVAFGDVNGDGHLDAFTGVATPDAALGDTNEILLNQGDGTFRLARSSPVRGDKVAAPAAATFVDLDRDGHLDLWLPQTSARQDRLLLGDGTGAFRDATEALGLLTEAWVDREAMSAGLAHSNAWSGAACDVDGDGRPDLLAASYGRAPNHLWVQRPDGTFENRSVASGYAYDHRQDWSDNASARCWCHLHPEAPDCEGVPAPERIRCEEDADAFRWNHANDRDPWRLGGNSGTTVCGDVDGDGDLDLLTTEIVHWDVGASSDPSELLLNDGMGTFTRPGNEVTGLTRAHDRVDWNDGDITAALLDVDNDGRLDVWIGSTDYPGARGLLWRQGEDGRFVEVPPDQGIAHPRAHGVAVADFDRDGDLDLLVGHSPMRCGAGGDCLPTPNVRLYENRLEGNFLQLQLVGTGGSNPSAIGARVTVRTSGRTQTAEVGGGHGHQGMQHDLVQHFGLGDACEAEVTVRWPDAEGTTETFTAPAGWRLRVVQGGGVAVVE